MLEEREGAVEPAAARLWVGDDDAVVGRATEHGMAAIFGAAAIVEVAADGIAAARRADQRHLAPARRLHDLRHEGSELLHLVIGRRPERLRLGIVAPRVGVGEIDGEDLIALVAVGLETPDVVDPERARIAVAVHEHDRRQGRFDDRLTARRPWGRSWRRRRARRLLGERQRRPQRCRAAEQSTSSEPSALHFISPRHPTSMLAKPGGRRYACPMSICYVDTPVGRLALEADHDAVTGVRWAGPGERSRDKRPSPLLKEATPQLDRYFPGKLKPFALPPAAPGTASPKPVRPTM